VPSELQLQAPFADLADACGLPAPQLALAWVLAQPGLTSVIVGPENAEHLERLIPAIDIEL
jgi:aryl-alcohol dehydrogenase-like predicted oxidoreductase